MSVVLHTTAGPSQGRAERARRGCLDPVAGLLRGKEDALVIVAGRNDRLDSPVEFLTGDTAFESTRWANTGLANFSGAAIYTKSFSLPDSFSGKRLMLDLGRVSSVADVFVNGAHAGTLIWRPYRLDITKLIKPGASEVKILITDTETDARAVGSWRRIPNAIDLCGLEGPVQIIPYVDETLTLRRQEQGGSTANSLQ